MFAQNEKQEEDGSSEFSQARQAALAEAMEAKSKVTKTFTQQVKFLLFINRRVEGRIIK